MTYRRFAATLVLGCAAAVAIMAASFALADRRQQPEPKVTPITAGPPVIWSGGR